MIYLYMVLFLLKGDDYMTKTKAAIEATRRYESANYDAVRVLLPKGTKERIKAAGPSVNGFIVRATLQALDSLQGEGRENK